MVGVKILCPKCCYFTEVIAQDRGGTRIWRCSKCNRENARESVYEESKHRLSAPRVRVKRPAVYWQAQKRLRTNRGPTRIPTPPL